LCAARPLEQGTGRGIRVGRIDHIVAVGIAGFLCRSDIRTNTELNDGENGDGETQPRVQ